MSAQTLSGLADSALLIVAMARLQALGAPAWLVQEFRRPLSARMTALSSSGSRP